MPLISFLIPQRLMTDIKRQYLISKLHVLSGTSKECSNKQKEEQGNQPYCFRENNFERMHLQ